MRLIGLTGGIATGKSTVARLLAQEHGAVVIDADQVARDVVAPGSPALAQIAEELGPQFIQSDGTLDRAALRQRIANDPASRSVLEGITHPAIRVGIESGVQAAFERGDELVVVEAALLVETGSYAHYPELWVVSCPPDVQLARLLARDEMTPSDAERLIASQAPMADKEAVATTIIRNDGDLHALKAAVSAALAG